MARVRHTDAKAVDEFGWTQEWKFIWLDGDDDENFLDHYNGPDLSGNSTFNVQRIQVHRR